jgi:hypothetical protein
MDICMRNIEHDSLHTELQFPSHVAYGEIMHVQGRQDIARDLTRSPVNVILMPV